MLYTGREQPPRTGDSARAGANERRAFTRRIDCDDAGRQRRPVNPSAGGQGQRDPQPARSAGRRLDID